MIIIPPEEVDEFLANESGVIFTEEQLDFFCRQKRNIMSVGHSNLCLYSDNYI